MQEKNDKPVDISSLSPESQAKIALIRDTIPLYSEVIDSSETVLELINPEQKE